MAPHRSAMRLAVINFSSSGDNTVVAAFGSSPINVYCIRYTVNGATVVTYKDNATALSGGIILTGNGSSETLPMSDEPWYQIQPGDAFIMNSSNAVTFGGNVWYTLG